MKKVSILISGILICFVILACDNSLNPVNEESGLYSFYASLDMKKDTNFIRIRELSAPFTAEATEEIDAVVTLENLNSGEVQVLEHERQAYEDLFFHNFAVKNAIEPNTDYKLTITRSDGESESDRARTPTVPAPVIEPENPNCFTSITATIAPVYSGFYQYQYRFVAGDTLQSMLVTRSIGDDDSIKINFTPESVVRLWTLGRSCTQLSSNIFTLYIKRYGPGFYEKISNDSLDILETTRLFGAYYEEEIVIPLDLSASKKRR